MDPFVHGTNCQAHGTTPAVRVAMLTITGLECADCAAKLQQAIAILPGVVDTDLNFASARLKVAFRPAEVSEATISQTIRDLGYGTKAARAMTTGLRSEYLLRGLDCGDCAEQLASHLSTLPGVREARVNFGAATLEVIFAQQAPQPDIPAAVAAFGYEAKIRKAGAHFWRNHRKTWSTIISGISFAGGLIAEQSVPWLATYIFGLSVLAGGYYMAKAARLALRSSHGLDINSLMTLAVIGAIGLGRWQEAAEVVCFFAAGNALAAMTMDRTRFALRSLLSLAPPKALVREGHREVLRPVEEVPVGVAIIIRPGERIPLDGEVIEGASTVDESALTGEYQPVAKPIGATVYAGSINGHGALAVRVQKRNADTALSRIVQLVEEAQAQRIPIQQLVDRFAKWYTPAILVLASSAALLPALLALLGHVNLLPLFVTWPEVKEWIYQALALLIVSCPCALIISTPVAVAAAIANASRKGLLIKGGVFLEALGRIHAVAFDKTGTLTMGQPVVADVIATNGYQPSELLTIAAALEHRSEHPLAEAILRKHSELHGHSVASSSILTGENCNCSKSETCSTVGRSLFVVDDFKIFPGRGVAGRVDGRLVFVGNPPFMTEQGISLSEASLYLADWHKTGKTPILVGSPDEGLLGMLAITDTLRTEAKVAIKELRKAGIRHVAILTGDHRVVAEPLATTLGADEVIADLLPDDKVRAIRDLANRQGNVLMVGDGINDAPALATATVGVALGIRGTDAALETADVILMQDNLKLLAPAIYLGRRAIGIIRQNIILSLSVKLILVLLAIPHWLSLALAVAGDVGITLVVVLNSMRLLRSRVWAIAEKSDK
ncbi:MAG: heavy metal translocating P-type ATPase [Cyanobacteria bacterium NC_groundwater_1444_Ag_S-0.65um_54_12]|nr:heavy metal translocating P-type ATPase [Cyanobacteria bacterium NC_groundwater_1444_Ag_S-0.65um_54_12]